MIAAALVVAVFVFLAPPTDDIDRQPDDVVAPPDASPSTVTTIAPTTTVTTTTVPSTTVTSLAPVVPAEGPLFGVETGVLILLDDGLSGIVAIDPDKRLAARSAVEGQRPGDEPYSMVRVGDSLVVGWSEIFAADIETRASTSLGFATIFVPAAEQDRVWLIDWPGGRIGSGTPQVWQVSLAGEQLTEPAELDAVGFPAFGIPGGLVLQAAQGLVLWDAATGETELLTARGRGFVLDVRGDELAWCESPCTELHVTDLATSVTESHPAPAGSTGFRAGSGSFGAPSTFSPDGLWLAAIVENSGGDLWVLNRQTGEVRVRGDALRVDYLAWAPDSQQLFATSYSYGLARTVVWRYAVASGDLQAVLLPFGGGLAPTVVDGAFAEAYLGGTSLGEECPAIGSAGRSAPCSFGF